MAKLSPVVLDYGRPLRRSRPRGLIAVLIAVLVFGARVGWLHLHRPVAIAPPPPPAFSPLAVGVDMRLTNSLNHSSEGQNVLYADGHSMPTTRPYGGENRGQNSNTWLDNIYTVSTSTQKSSGGVVSGLPYDDKDAIMLPTSGQE